MKDFEAWLKKNEEKCFADAYANSKHDKDGHCLISKDDPWMKEDCWDEDFRRLEMKGNRCVTRC